MELAITTKIIELRARGVSFSKIAKEVGISKQTAIDECKRQEEKLSVLKAIEWDSFLEEYNISKQERLKGVANLLSRVREEIEGRSLEDIPTEKLIDLYTKLNSTLKEEILEPTFTSSQEQEEKRREDHLLNMLSQLAEE